MTRARSNHIVSAAAIVGMLLAVSQSAFADLGRSAPLSEQTADAGRSALLEALRQGGYIIVMRHASSPQAPPDKAHANADNVKLERQLDEAGREGATAMGNAIRERQIPVGAVFSSPTYRALETAKYAGLRNAQPVEQLGDGGQSMAAVADAAAAWLRERTSQPPARGSNTILITHLPNIERAFPDWKPRVADGESVVLQPDGRGGARVIGRIRIEEWPRLPLR